MRRTRAALACVLAGALAVAGCGADTEPHTTPTAGQPPATAPAPSTTPDTTTPDASPAPAKFTGPLAFHVKRRTQLRATPHGRVVATIRTKTEFKSPTILAVAGRKPGWVRVRTSVEKHPLGWVPIASGSLFSEPRAIVIDLSQRSLSVFHRGHRTDTYKVAIGTAATPTPSGRFAVTDRLKVRPGTDYGCCILALTAHQPKILQGWGGGDRVAIHATPNTAAIGRRVSHGCVRASNAALHRLMRQMRLGAPVTIHA